jgi:hypothetical protein
LFEVKRLMSPGAYTYQDAIRDFQSARQKAGIQEVLARLSGKPARLLSYEEVAEKLKLHIRASRSRRSLAVWAAIPISRAPSSPAAWSTGTAGRA